MTKKLTLNLQQAATVWVAAAMVKNLGGYSKFGFGGHLTADTANIEVYCNNLTVNIYREGVRIEEYKTFQAFANAYGLGKQSKAKAS